MDESGNREEQKKQKERGALAAFAMTDCYKALFSFPTDLFEDSERPDFVATHNGKKIGVEVLRFQTPRQEPFEQDCPPNILKLNPDGSIIEETFLFQDVTPTLLNKKAKAPFRKDVRDGKYQLTSMVAPGFISAEEIERGYVEIATKGLLRKFEKIARYASCDFQLLLVEDCLSMSDFALRMENLKRWLTTVKEPPKFSAIVVLNRIDERCFRLY